MTKRYKEVYPDIIRSNYCFTDNGKGITDKEVVNLLNNYDEETKRLKQEIKMVSDLKLFSRRALKSENILMKTELEKKVDFIIKMILTFVGSTQAIPNGSISEKQACIWYEEWCEEIQKLGITLGDELE